jgi:hypothetical protein
MKILKSYIFNKYSINALYNSSINCIIRKNFARNILKSFKSNTNENIPYFNKRLSKYKLDESITKEQIIQTKQMIPKYLSKEFNNTLSVNSISDSNTVYSANNFKTSNNIKSKNKKIIKRKLQAGKRLVVAKKVFQKKPKKETLIKETRDRRNSEFEQRKFAFLSKSDKKLLLNKDWSINRHNLEFVDLEKKKLKNELQVFKKDKKISVNKYFNTEDFEDKFNQEERLSKRLAKIGFCSRNYAEKLIELGLVKVDGQSVKSNVPVTANSNIRVLTKSGYKYPVKEDAKVWIFYKPQGYVCTSKDVRVS